MQCGRCGGLIVLGWKPKGLPQFVCSSCGHIYVSSMQIGRQRSIVEIDRRPRSRFVRWWRRLVRLVTRRR